MNYFSLASALTFLVCVYCIFTILKINIKSPTIILLAIYLLSFAFWSLGYVFVYVETNKDVVWFWYKFAAIGWISAQFFMLMFFIALTQNKFFIKHYWLVFILALIPIWLLYKQFTGVLLVKDFVMTSLGNIEIIDNNSVGVWLIPLNYLFFTIISIFILLFGIKKSHKQEIRNIYKWFIFLNVIIYIVIISFNILIPVLNIHIPSIGVFTTGVFSFIILYITIRHNFFYINLNEFDSNRNVSVINGVYRLEAIFHNIQNGIIAIDDKYCIVRCNKYISELFNNQISIGKTKCYKLFHKRSNSCPDCPIKNMDGRSVNNHKYSILFNGKKRYFNVHYYPIVGKYKQFSGYVQVLTDVTDLLQQQQIQEDTERIIRHDLKNHLYSITGYSAYYKDLKEIYAENAREIFGMIHSEAKKMNEIINSSLALIKLEKGEYKVIKEKVSLYLLIVQVKFALEKLIKQKNITIDYEALKKNSDAFKMYGEMLLLENMFLNLIKNAIESATENSRITISGEADVDMELYEGIIVITIHNVGIVPNNIREVFFDKYTTGKSGGTGLGNYTALLIAKAHSGDITYSTDEDEGTTITVRLARSNAVEQ